MSRKTLREWTVDYGHGPVPCRVPHAWRQDVDVRWEGPAVYRTTLEVPKGRSWLRFHGASYEAKVFVNEEPLGEHRGIWDAFSFDLSRYAGKRVGLRVEVTKNGGATFPVKDVLSGFLPYVFNTFGGIYQDVELISSEVDPLQSAIRNPKSELTRVSVKGTRLFVDRKPFYLRAPLTWGWYPELGHTNPPARTIRREAKLAKEMGFNTMKFCLWVPPHRYFDILNEESMFAWLELPLWNPIPDPEKQEAMFQEMERITRQYAHHDNIIVWTCGCELSSNTTAEFRERLYKMVKEITGCPLVKDNSGGSEMYGGDLREFGDFYDFHPYCDLPFYPQVLDSLLIGPRKKMPILLGEFNDVDVFRDLARLRRERPYWASTDPALNDQGVRWAHDLPRVVEESRWAKERIPELPIIRHESESKARFIRETVLESVRSSEQIAGYVITGWRDTPISSSGLLDDWSEHRTWLDATFWNRDVYLFAIPSRRPLWVNGGNRAGWNNVWNVFEGEFHLAVGAHTTSTQTAALDWGIKALPRESGEKIEKVAEGVGQRQRVRSNEPGHVGEVSIPWLEAREGWQYALFARWGTGRFTLKVFVHRKPEFYARERWSARDQLGLLQGLALPNGPNIVSTQLTSEVGQLLERGLNVVQLLYHEATDMAPFWRECAVDYPDAVDEPLIHDWERFLPVSPDRVIDLDALYSYLPKKSEIKVLINRIDTRTYKEAPIMVEVKCGKGRMLATTLRPYGGLGCQPYGVMNNPAGAALLESMMRYLEEK